MTSYTRLLETVSITTLLLSACRIVVDTKINPDGSGSLRHAVVYSAEEQQNFEQTPGNESASICDNLQGEVPAGATFTQEHYGNETYCVTTRSFTDLNELRQLYAPMDNVSVHELQFDLGRLRIDIDVDLRQEGDTPKAAQEWRLTLPGSIETHNADRVDGQTLIWSISPGQQVNLHAETRTGLNLRTLGITGLALLAGGLASLIAAFGLGAFFASRQRRRTPVKMTSTDTGGTIRVRSVTDKASLKQFLAFIAIGLSFAAVEEFLTVVVLKHDIASYLFTLLIMFPVFLSFVWWSSRVLGRFVHSEPARALAHFFLYGAIGLLIEWFIIGLSPWSDADANPVVMLLFQIGMFSFWATVGFAPRLLTDWQVLGRNTGKDILKFYVPYFMLVTLISFLAPAEMKFVIIIGLIVLGYLALDLFYLRYFLRSFVFSPAPQS